eukprot:1005766-Rhodomonas_salina.1
MPGTDTLLCDVCATAPPGLRTTSLRSVNYQHEYRQARAILITICLRVTRIFIPTPVLKGGYSELNAVVH